MRRPPPPVSIGSPSWLVLAARGQLVLGDALVSVTTVANGPSFVRLLRATRPRLAVVSAPPAGSMELLAAIAERRLRPELRLIFVNDPADVTGRLDALGLGFDDALQSSVDPLELIGRGRLLLDPGHPRPTTERRIPVTDDVVLDLVGRRVHRNGAEVHLRPKEFALLSLLASDPGRVFTRTELVEQVWGAGYHGGARTIDVHVRWLRAKLEPNPAKPAHVVTVRGVGYRLDPPV